MIISGVDSEGGVSAEALAPQRVPTEDFPLREGRKSKMKPSPIPVAGFSRIGDESALGVSARIERLRSEGRDVVNLSIGQPDFPTPEHIVEAAIKALRDGKHGYTDPIGILPLREAVARRTLARTGVEVPPERIAVTPGGKVAMFAAILMFGQPGAKILHPDPGFPIYRSMIDFSGAEAVPIPIREENQFAFGAEEVLSLMDEKVSLIILNSPANPTGGVSSREEISALVEGLGRFPNAAILSDEIYDSILFDGLEHVSLLEFPGIRDRLILLNGWSKTWAMTGWRMGWSIWPESLCEPVRRLAVNGWSCVNAPAQYGAIAALDGPQDGPDEMVRAFDRRRLLMVEALNEIPGISCLTPKGAFYAFPNVKQTGWESAKLASSLLEEAGVGLIAGEDFGTLGKGYLRLSCANSSQSIKSAMERIGNFLSR